MANIFTGFEGFAPVDEADRDRVLNLAPIVLDTNVLLGFYDLEVALLEPLREILLGIKDRLFMPAQVTREFWRNRDQKLLRRVDRRLNSEELATPLRQALNKAAHIAGDSDAVRDIRTDINENITRELDRIIDQIDILLGEKVDPVDWISNPADDRVLAIIAEVYDGKVEEQPNDSDYKDLIDKGLERIAQQIPPGFADASGKSTTAVTPEGPCGDYILWEQSLSFAETLPNSFGIIIVTNEKKEDWRMKAGGKVLASPLPSMNKEAISRTGGPLLLLDAVQFYRKFAQQSTNAQNGLIAVSEMISDLGSADYESSGWDVEAYTELIWRLHESGHSSQAQVIETAAKFGGSVRRDVVYQIDRRDEGRSLRRFSLPAVRTAREMANEGIIPEDAEAPLSADYDGPGRAIGFRVPFEFTQFVREPTWMEAARMVMEDCDDPSREWHVRELVQEIDLRGIKDISNALTPENTLARDLAHRSNGQFLRVKPNTFILRGGELRVMSL